MLFTSRPYLAMVEELKKMMHITQEYQEVFEEVKQLFENSHINNGKHFEVNESLETGQLLQTVYLNYL